MRCEVELDAALTVDARFATRCAVDVPGRHERNGLRSPLLLAAFAMLVVRSIIGSHRDHRSALLDRNVG